MSVNIPANLIQRWFTWTAWKSIHAVKGSPFQFEDDGVLYTIWSYDGNEILLTQIWKATVPALSLETYSQEQNELDKLDFENNYKARGNLSLNQLDTDGATVIRLKAAKKGWTYVAIPIEFKTSETGSLHSKFVDGTDRPGISLKFYGQDGLEIASENLSQVSEGTVIRSVIDFEPAYDYEIIGGELRIEQDLVSGQDCRLYIIAAPDIPANYGGSKEMAGGVNLRYLSPQNVMSLDGRVSKTLVYDQTLHTNKIRLIFQHAIELKIFIHITLELYRP